MGIKFETNWGVAARIFDNTNEERVFGKMVINLSLLEVIFEAYFQRLFFWEKCKGIFL